jgi:hypothetical protein
MASTDAIVDVSMRIMLTISDYDPGTVVQASPDIKSASNHAGEAVIAREESRTDFSKTTLAPSSSTGQVPLDAQFTELDRPTNSMAHMLRTLEATTKVADVLAEVQTLNYDLIPH